MKQYTNESKYPNLSNTTNVKGKPRKGIIKKNAHQPVLTDSSSPIVIPKDTDKKSLFVYTDGSTLNNGQANNRGSYAYIVVENGKTLHEYSKAITNTTNNRCEMHGVIEAIQYLEENHKEVPATIYSDSQYCVRGINEWASAWHQRGYTGIKNPEEWKVLYALAKSNPHIKVCWVKGHSTNIYNQRCDTLCTQAYDKVEVTPIGNTPDNQQGAYINHKDGNLNNNEPANLEIVDIAANKRKVSKKEVYKGPTPEAIVEKVWKEKKKLDEPNKLLLEVYELALTDGDPIPTLLKITAYLVKSKLI